jgi:hypothetical protein
MRFTPGAHLATAARRLLRLGEPGVAGVYARIVVAAVHGRGVLLKPEEVALIARDHAVGQAVLTADEEDGG